MKKLLLHNPEDHGGAAFFPEKLDRVVDYYDIDGNPVFMGRDKVELAIKKKLNRFNSAMSIESIEYVDIKERFQSVEAGCYTGLIVEEKEITPSEKEPHQSKGEYVYWDCEDNAFKAQKIFAYVFISPEKVQARNSFVSQAIFPELLDYMERYLSSPSFTIANHPIFFINISKEQIKAKSIIRNFIGLELLDIRYFELFGPSFDPHTDMPTVFEDLLIEYYNCTKMPCRTDWFEVNGLHRYFSFDFSKFVPGGLLELNSSGNVQFHGSNEKFFILNALPVAVWALKAGYDVDLSSFETFCKNEGPYKFSVTDKKFPRVVTMYKYLKKLKERINS